jgi:hypothetical protein
VEGVAKRGFGSIELIQTFAEYSSNRKKKKKIAKHVLSKHKPQSNFANRVMLVVHNSFVFILKKINK